MTRKSAISAVIVFLFFSFLSSSHSLSSIDQTHEHVVCETWSKQQKCFRTGLAVQCFGGLDDLMNLHPAKLKKVEELILCDWPNPTTFDLNTLKPFTNLKKFIVEHSNFTHFSHDFPELDYLESINISRTNLHFTRPTLFKKLPALQYVDLRWNQLDHIEHPFQMVTELKELYLKDNPWNCTTNLKWLHLLTPEEHHVIDIDELRCTDIKYNGRPVTVVMQFKVQLKKECQNNSEISNCSCHVNYIRPNDDGKSFTPMYAINCSQLNLDRLPSELPANTSILFATHNRISNLKPLRNNPFYKDVHDIYLDDNAITSLEVLENSEWIENFRIFSLRRNKLTKIPVYAIVDAFEKNHHVGKLYLSHNPWKCDCGYTPKFQDLLRKFENIINDHNNVTCGYVEGDKNSGSVILSLKRSDVCLLIPESKIQPLNILNCVLGSMIFLILSKLAYDYYYYKHYGRVPWIVTKMP